MSDGERDGGEAACWLHEFAFDRDDIRTRADLRALVDAFCREVATDQVLGPVFAELAAERGVLHDALVELWAAQLLREPTNDPSLRTHRAAQALRRFDGRDEGRWVELFEATVDANFAGPTAALAKGRARHLASTLRRQRGEAEPDL